jgi:hypothetical protein
MRDTYTRLTRISTASMRLTYLLEAGALGETTSCALLPKYTKSDQHTEGKKSNRVWARELNSDYAAVLRRKKDLEIRKSKRNAFVFVLRFTGEYKENMLQQFTIASSRVSAGHLDKHCCGHTELHFGAVLQSNQYVVYTRPDSRWPQKCSSGYPLERERGKERELDGWRVLVLRWYRKDWIENDDWELENTGDTNWLAYV